MDITKTFLTLYGYLFNMIISNETAYIGGFFITLKKERTMPKITKFLQDRLVKERKRWREIFPKEDKGYYVFNTDKIMAIKVPKRGKNALFKIHEEVDPQTNLFHRDLLAMIFQYRKAVPNSFTRINKLLHAAPLAKLLTDSEFESLREFIYSIPPGYDLHPIILPHSEFGSVVS